MSDFGSRLRHLRLERNLGIKKLARELRISYTYISHIERGKIRPSKDLIRRMAACFGVDQEDLLLASGRFPKDIEEILNEKPREVVIILRESFSGYKQSGILNN